MSRRAVAVVILVVMGRIATVGLAGVQRGRAGNRSRVDCRAAADRGPALFRTPGGQDGIRLRLRAASVDGEVIAPHQLPATWRHRRHGRVANWLAVSKRLAG